MKGVLPIIFLFLTGCASMNVDDNRVGCNFNDGQGSARYGTLTQYAKGTGDVKGVHVYVGNKLIGHVKVTCNADRQEVKIDTAIED